MIRILSRYTMSRISSASRFPMARRSTPSSVAPMVPGSPVDSRGSLAIGALRDHDRSPAERQAAAAVPELSGGPGEVTAAAGAHLLNRQLAGDEAGLQRLLELDLDA